ncbi:hypothetical protein YC2023_005336 [Brassica napus]
MYGNKISGMKRNGCSLSNLTRNNFLKSFISRFIYRNLIVTQSPIKAHYIPHKNENHVPGKRIKIVLRPYDGVYKNDFLELEFEPLFPGAPKLTGEEVINKLTERAGTSFEGDTGENKYDEPRQETFFQENAGLCLCHCQCLQGDICLSVHFHLMKALTLQPTTKKDLYNDVSLILINKLDPYPLASADMNFRFLKINRMIGWLIHPIKKTKTIGGLNIVHRSLHDGQSYMVRTGVS